ncbi:protease-4 [Nitrosospira sp. Nl5]|jgi:protease-4|uniref:S49 family peptidase n=1 Tax=Nitrosospira sp. Nl5 TaxID=200120 RepID=UPI00088EAC72|nr:S49 family peptidase [Nitrosospira sp. Nl5]SCY69039.1 protease-4 [Nitrosospira sp. Nl5]
MADSENRNESWEKQVLEKLMLSSLQEQRRARHWSVFFKSLAFIYLFILLFYGLGWFGGNDMSIAGKHTALVELRGVISPDSVSSADNINAGLQNAFKDEKTRGVILRINSPGGSPVQAGYINDEIRRLRAEYPKIPLYAVVEDICASGGYYVAVAADKIYVDKASVVGSIGVLMNGFGFTGAMEKLGVDRRLITAGKNKGFLDPFSPPNPEQEEHAKEILGDVHQQFIQVVQQGRGKRLKEAPEIFSGIVWTGQKSIDLGLTDAIGSAEYVAREIIKAEHIVDYTTREGFAERFARRFGAVVADTLISAGNSWGLR